MARVLVVDDEPGIRNTLKEFLRASGHDVFLACDVQEGKQVLTSTELDVIVLDVVLPRESGVELLRYVHESYPGIETIMMTGEPTIETTVLAMRLGAFDFLAKPVSGNQMCMVVDQAAKKKAEREKTKIALHKAEVALRESERLYSMALNNTTDMIFVTSPEGRVTFINNAAREHYDLTDLVEVSELYLHLWFFWCGDDINAVHAAMEQARVDLGPRSLDCQCSDRHYNLVLAPVVEDQRVLSIICVARDITNRKRAEKALRESENRYRLLAENSRDVVWTMDVEGRFLYVSPSVELLCGYTSEEFVNLSLSDLIPVEDFIPLRELLEQEVIRPPELRDGWARLETQQKTKSGDTIDIEITSTWILDEAGNIAGVQGTTRDITERKLAEEQLKESEERFRSIVESSPMGIITGEVIGEGPLVVTSANSAAVEILQINEDELELKSDKKTLDTVLRVPFARELADHMRQAALAGSIWDTELTWYSQDGDEHNIELHVFQTSPAEAAVQFLDTTARRRVEAERVRLVDQLQQSQRLESIGILAGGIAHDMNNFLGVIMASSSVLQSDIDPESPCAKDVASILAACRRGREMTQNLLRFSRRGKVVRERFSVSEMAMATKELLRRTIIKKVEIEEEIDKDLWFIEGDRSLIGQALMNICLNAVDAMPRGGKLSICARNVIVDSKNRREWGDVEIGNYVLLEVSDTGEGMNHETLDHAFEPFFTTKPKGAGAGLGLSFVYGTARSHGGAAKLKSALGIGSSASLLLPAVTHTPIPKRVSSIPSNSSTVLLVDDEVLIRYAGRRILEKMGHQVLEAPDGDKALDLFVKESERISLVILDLIMPRMDGEETFRALKEINPDVKVLVSSGYPTREKVDTLLANGALGFIEKPFDYEHFSKMVSNVLG